MVAAKEAEIEDLHDQVAERQSVVRHGLARGVSIFGAMQQKACEIH